MLVVMSMFDSADVFKSSVKLPVAVPAPPGPAVSLNVTLSRVKFATVSTDAGAAKPSAAIATAIPSLVFIVSPPV